ncbi:MAG: hypothetical protein ICV66_00985 [Chitinophagaceae bacterium]|nr:hypothetical protein [Chitinophagaceae bacterium]
MLEFLYTGGREFSGEFSTHHTSEETKYWKLTLLNNLFDISRDNNKDVRQFIIDEVHKDIDGYLGEGKIVDSHSMREFPSVIKIISSYAQLDAKQLISYYCDSITFTTEFDSFYDFKEIFPTEFESFIKENIASLKKAIKYQIIDDIDYYRWYDMDFELDTHLDYMIEEVCKKYQIRLTSKFVAEIEEMAECSLFRSRNSSKRKTKKAYKATSGPRRRYKPKKFDAILEEYISDEPYENFDPVQYLKSINADKNLVSTLRKEINSEESLVKPFIGNKDIFSYLVQLIQSEDIHVGSSNRYAILDSVFTLYCTSKNLDTHIFKKIFFELSKDSFGHDFSITKKQLQSLFKEYHVSEYEAEILSPIIVAGKSWYNFSSHEFKIYFIVEYLSTIKSDEEFKEEVIDYSLETYEADLLKLLNYRCRQRLLDVVVIPELERFLCSIDSSSPKSILLSFLRFFGVEFDLKWNKRNKQFEESSSSNQESFIEIIIQYLGIDFSIISFDIYFTKCYHIKEAIQKYFIDTKVYSRLYARVISVIPVRKGRDILTKEDAAYFDINLYDFADNAENYSILQEIGMEKYVLNLYKDTQAATEQVQTSNKALLKAGLT